MSLNGLPSKSMVNRIVPKNAFDDFTNTRQKKQIVDLIERIKWTHKLSIDTVNLAGKEISEIQIFEIELRKKDKIAELLQVIDKAIPYPIIFYLCHRNEIAISASLKHRHPANEDLSVIDWTFSTNDWIKDISDQFKPKLERSLDYVFFTFCKNLSGRFNSAKTVAHLATLERKYSDLAKAIEKQKYAVTACKQFNKKVELNTELLKMQAQLNVLVSTN